MMAKLILSAVVAVAGGAIIRLLPDLTRYMKMREM